MELTLRQLMDVDLIPLIVFIVAGSFIVCFSIWPKRTVLFLAAGTFVVLFIECILFFAKALFKGY